VVKIEGDPHHRRDKGKVAVDAPVFPHKDFVNGNAVRYLDPVTESVPKTDPDHHLFVEVGSHHPFSVVVHKVEDAESEFDDVFFVLAPLGDVDLSYPLYFSGLLVSLLL